MSGEEITGTFYEKELQETNQEEFRNEKAIERKGNKIFVNWKGYDNSVNSWTDKNTLYKMSQYFPKPYGTFGRGINVKVNLSTYAAKAILKMRQELILLN